MSRHTLSKAFWRKNWIWISLAVWIMTSIIMVVLLSLKKPKFVRRAHAPLKPIYHWHDDRDRQIYNAAIDKRIGDEWTTDQLNVGRVLVTSILVGLSGAWLTAWFLQPNVKPPSSSARSSDHRASDDDDQDVTMSNAWQ